MADWGVSNYDQSFYSSVNDGWQPPFPYPVCNCSGNTSSSNWTMPHWFPFEQLSIVGRAPDFVPALLWVDVVAKIACITGMSLALLSFLKLLVRSLSGRLALLQGLFRGEAVTPAFQEKLQEYKAGQLRGLLQIFCYLLLPVSMLRVSMPNHSMTFEMELLGVAVAQDALALIAFMPAVVTPRRLDIFFSGTALLAAFLVTPVTCGEMMVLPMLILGNAMMTALVAVRRTNFTRLPLLPVFCSLFALCACSTILLKGRHDIGGLRRLAAVAQGLLMLTLASAAPVLERRARAEMYRLLEQEEMQERLSASQCLLRSCFDVVVELDAAGCVLDGGRELAALLLREGSMQGASVAELMEGQDFTARLASPTMRDTGLAESMQASMRDSCGNSLQLELMWFGYTCMGRRERHFMLGLREHSEPGFERGPLPALPSIVVAVPNTGRGVQGITRMEIATSDTSSLPETHSVSSGSFVDLGAVVVVDASNFSVKRVSGCFRARVGLLRVGERLTSKVKKARHFERWLAKALCSREPIRDCGLIFNMPQGKVGALCKVLEKKEGEAKLLFYGISEEPMGEARPSQHNGTNAKRPSFVLREAKVAL